MENYEENYFMRIQDLINEDSSTTEQHTQNNSYIDKVFGYDVRISWLGVFNVESIGDINEEHHFGRGETLEDAKYSFVYSVARADSDYYAKRKYKKIYKEKFKKLKKQLKKAKKW